MSTDYMPSETEAREMAAHWISPADPELCRFATGHDRNPGSHVDWTEFLMELDKCRPYADANGVNAEDHHKELDKLCAYAEVQLLEEMWEV